MSSNSIQPFQRNPKSHLKREKIKGAELHCVIENLYCEYTYVRNMILKTFLCSLKQWNHCQINRGKKTVHVFGLIVRYIGSTVNSLFGFPFNKQVIYSISPKKTPQHFIALLTYVFVFNFKLQKTLILE